MTSENLKNFIGYKEVILHENKSVVLYVTMTIMILTAGTLWNLNKGGLAICGIVIALLGFSIIRYKSRLKNSKEEIYLYNGLGPVTMGLAVINVTFRIMNSNNHVPFWKYIIIIFLLIGISMVVVFLITKSRIEKGEYYKYKKEIGKKHVLLIAVLSVGLVSIIKLLNNWMEILSYLLVVCILSIYALSVPMFMRYYYIKKYNLQTAI
ncbi:MAG: hypothetical protein VB031_05925 [Eubacteriaceae bacterium]|nr:hypothetical protein [Eubacteriaceae bacterium]